MEAEELAGGRRIIWDYVPRIPLPISCTPAKEATFAIAVARKHGMDHYQVDAEAPYRNQPGWADEDSREANRGGPGLFLTLGASRCPPPHHPAFPARIFAPAMDGWSPQVYFLGDNRINGGAIQLEMSSKQDAQVRLVPYIRVAPTYLAAGPW